MKKVSEISLVPALFAVLSILFVSCQKENSKLPDTSKRIRFTTTIPETKTVFGEKNDKTYPTLWTKNKKVEIMYNGATRASSEIEKISEDGKIATFSASFVAEESAENHVFFSLSPSEAFKNVDVEGVKVVIPPVQTPLAGSCDEAAQIIAAYSIFEEFPSEISLKFTHLSAYGKMSLVLPAGTGEVSSVELSASKVISGDCSVTLSELPTLKALGSASKTITIKTKFLNDIFFASIPEALKGESLKVTVTTENGEKLVKMISFQMNSGFQFKAGTVSSFTVDLSDCGEAIRPIQYATKKYGEKTWMTTNCREAGEDGKLGQSWDLTKFASKVAWDGTPTDKQKRDALIEINDNAGRYYTWFEAMTGISACTKAQYEAKIESYNGIDDAGNAFKLDGTEKGEYNVQLRGCCPEGWHVANCNDWWDLFHAIKSEYNVGEDIYDGDFSFKGGCHASMGPVTKDEFYLNGSTVKNMGNAGAWLRGGNGRVMDGGVWCQANKTLKDKDATGPIPQFVSGADEVGFGWYPAGRVEKDAVTFNTKAIGKYGFLWFVCQQDGDYARSLCISSKSMNLNTMNTKRVEALKLAHLNVRCVKNY